MPLVCLGSGYLTPPGGRLLPPMRPWRSGVARRSVRHEHRILEACNTIRRANGLTQYGFLGGVFQGNTTLVATDPGPAATENHVMFWFRCDLLLACS